MCVMNTYVKLLNISLSFTIQFKYMYRIWLESSFYRYVNIFFIFDVSVFYFMKQFFINQITIFLAFNFCALVFHMFSTSDWVKCTVFVYAFFSFTFIHTILFTVAKCVTSLCVYLYLYLLLLCLIIYFGCCLLWQKLN